MAWSATAAACEVMDALFEYCRQTNDRGNSWQYKGSEYFAELGQEHQDGHISMTIYKMVGENRCKRSGSIYIEPDGNIRHMPPYLKKAIAPYYWPKQKARMQAGVAAAEPIRELWVMACDFDDIPSDSLFVNFSQGNRYAEKYNAARLEFGGLEMSEIIRDQNGAAFIEQNCVITGPEGQEFSAGGSWLMRRKDTGKFEAFLYFRQIDGRYYVGTWDGSENFPAIVGREWRDNFGGVRQSVWFKYQGLYFYGVYYKSAGDYVRARQITEKAYNN